MVIIKNDHCNKSSTVAPNGILTEIRSFLRTGRFGGLIQMKRRISPDLSELRGVGRLVPGLLLLMYL